VTRPTLTFIAAANGSGKATLTRWNPELFREIPLLDPDALTNTLQATTSTLFPIAAARQVLKSAAEHLNRAESFAVETTLAGKNYLQMMVDARNCGFEIMLVYIGTESVEINLERIRHSVLAGGHNVPEADVLATLQAQLSKSADCSKTRRSLHPVRQLDGSWLSPSSNLEPDRRSMVGAKTGLGSVWDVNCLAVCLGNDRLSGMPRRTNCS